MTASRSPRSPGALLAVVCLAQFMVLLDVSVVNVALPAIRGGLGFSADGLQWVVNAYTIAFAGLLLLGGRAGDLLGHRRVFLTGTAIFALASLACALASSRGVLIGARALQGLGGAVISPATLSILTRALPEGPERNRGLGLWGAVGALGASSGAILGGLLTQGLGWEAIFAINVPLGAALLVAGLRVIPRVAPLETTRHFDVAGAALVTAGLTALTFGIVRTERLGWGDAGVLAPLAAAIVLLGAFVLVEARLAAAPLVPLSVFRIAPLRAANLVIVLLYVAFFPVFYFLTLFLQLVLGHGAIVTGLAFLPMTLSIFAGSTLAPRAVGRFGPRAVIAGGTATATAGMVVLSRLTPEGGYVGAPLLGSFLVAVGFGFTLVPATIVAVRGLPDDEAGLGSGLLNTSRLLGGALGLAILTTIAAAHTDGPGAAALTHGYATAFAVGAVVSATACVAGLVLLAVPRPATAWWRRLASAR